MATKTTKKGASGAAAEVQETGTELVEAAKQEVATKAGEVREDAAFRIREQVGQRSNQAGEQIEAVAQALRSGGEQLRTEGKASSADLVENLARRADDLGGYLKGTDADRILGDVEDFARRRPWLVAGAAAVAGFVTSRLVKASSDRRYEAAYAGRSTGYTQQGLPAGSGQ
jgi:hypothetical protein